MKNMKFTMTEDSREVVVGDDIYVDEDDFGFFESDEEAQEVELTEIMAQFRTFLRACGYSQEMVEKVNILTPDVIAKYQLTEA